MFEKTVISYGDISKKFCQTNVTSEDYLYGKLCSFTAVVTMKKSFLLILKKLNFGIGINNLEENHNDLHFLFSL